jgi:hypothetical protein
VELAPVAGVEAPATRLSVGEPASATAAPAGATEAPQPSRKSKWGFSNLR